LFDSQARKLWHCRHDSHVSAKVQRIQPFSNCGSGILHRKLNPGPRPRFARGFAVLNPVRLLWSERCDLIAFATYPSIQKHVS
jgi:hypothetical protein